MAEENVIDQYLELTGQTFDEVTQGAADHGLDFILLDLIPQALEEKKKIVWSDSDKGLGSTSYSLEDL